MRAALDDASGIKDVDDICFLDGRQTMSDGDGSPSLRRGIECRLHHLLALRVESTGRLVQQENLRVADECACDRNTLLLSTGEEGTFGATHGVEAFRE
jgi:hypothetical protein